MKRSLLGKIVLTVVETVQSAQCTKQVEEVRNCRVMVCKETMRLETKKISSWSAYPLYWLKCVSICSNVFAVSLYQNLGNVNLGVSCKHMRKKFAETGKQFYCHTL